MIEYTPQNLSFSKLLEKAKSLPLKPGIYLFYDKKGQIIYVGKSRALKNRVLSYFQNRGRHTLKTERLVQSVRDFLTIVTATETEALILENEKIKLHQPKFNIRLKDDKNYPYIRISTNEEFPRLAFSRSRKKGDKAKFFGPYSSSSAVRTAIDTANKIFHLPTCKRKFPQEIGKGRPCLYYQMGRCVGVCTGKVTPEDYAKRMDDVFSFFRGDHKKVVSSLEDEMNVASEKMEFEKAAVLRDRIRALTTLGGAKQVVRDLHFSADVIGSYSDELGGDINILSVRQGRLVDSINFHFGAEEILSPETLPSFLLSYYQKNEVLPKEILVSPGLWSEELVSVSQALSTENKKLRFHKPERGEGRALVKMADENAREAEFSRRRAFEKDQEVLVTLASVLSLEVYPERIESIDISNTGSEHITAGMITLENGRFLKKAYKSFTIALDHPDDTASMKEAITRRVKRYIDGDAAFSPLPDLILVDGGVGQVNAVKSALAELGVEIPTFGMVKDAFHKTRCLTDGEKEISIAKDQRLFQFIYQIQEEVHRYSLSRMDTKRRKKVKRSTLCDIPGIGEKKAAVLLKHFKSIRGIKNASLEELSAAPGVSRKDAVEIYTYYNKEKEES